MLRVLQEGPDLPPVELTDVELSVVTGGKRGLGDDPDPQVVNMGLADHQLPPNKQDRKIIVDDGAPI